MFERPAWHAEAACRGMTPEKFYASNTLDWLNADYEPAKQVCATCPVTAECLAFAEENRERHGVWGGMTPEERNRYRKRVQRQARLGQQVLSS